MEIENNFGETIDEALEVPELKGNEWNNKNRKEGATLDNGRERNQRTKLKVVRKEEDGKVLWKQGGETV